MDVSITWCLSWFRYSKAARLVTTEAPFYDSIRVVWGISVNQPKFNCILNDLSLTYTVQRYRGHKMVFQNIPFCVQNTIERYIKNKLFKIPVKTTRTYIPFRIPLKTTGRYISRVNLTIPFGHTSGIPKSLPLIYHSVVSWSVVFCGIMVNGI